MSRSRYVIYFVDWLLLFIFNMIISSNLLLAFLFSLSQTFGIYAFRGYDLQSLSNLSESIVRILFGTAFGFIGVLLFYPIIYKYIDNFIFVFNGLFTIIIFPISHKIEYNVYIKKRSEKKYLVIGDKKEIKLILQEIEEKSLGKMKFLKYISSENLNIDIDYSLYDAVLITHYGYEKSKNALKYITKRKIKVEYLPNLCERYLKRIPIEVVKEFREYYEVYFEYIEDDPTKRLFDILTSIFALIVFSPFMLIVSLLIFIEDGCPVIIKQNRMGKYNYKFLMHKFRSLTEVDEDLKNPNTNIEQRVLKIGKIIRKTRLDETMQFLNVLIGNMSIVGPRPEMIQFHLNSVADIPFYDYRLKTNPGITGWAQINYKHTSTLEDYKIKTEYDLYYVKNKNIFLDVKIMLKTIEAMLGMRGAR